MLSSSWSEICSGYHLVVIEISPYDIASHLLESCFSRPWSTSIWSSIFLQTPPDSWSSTLHWALHQVIISSRLLFFLQNNPIAVQHLQDSSISYHPVASSIQLAQWDKILSEIGYVSNLSQSPHCIIMCPPADYFDISDRIARFIRQINSTLIALQRVKLFLSTTYMIDACKI